VTAAAANHAQADRVVVFCPECGHRYALKPDALAQPGLKVLCGTCESVFTPGDKPAPRPVTAVGAVRQTVVVAHESPAVCATVGRVLEDSGYAARYVHDGARAVAAFDASLPDHPVALVLDVGVPQVMAFQVIQILRGRPGAGAVKIILLASVFERTRYKRRPTSLHGADGYVELHHVPDRLGGLLTDLLHAQSTPAPRTHLPVERAVAESLRPASEPVLGEEGARGLARRLVSDVALYHEGAMANALKEGHGPLHSPEVAAAMGEARDIFMKATVRVGAAASSIFEEVLTDLVAGLARGLDPGARRP
jgi:predicted Zn finger-like uncharacterized protein